jgi:hypothetical protein
MASLGIKIYKNNSYGDKTVHLSVTWYRHLTVRIYIFLNNTVENFMKKYLLRWDSWKYILYFIISAGAGVAWLVEALCYKSRIRFPMRSLDFFNWPNPSSRTMTLGSTQPLTEMSTRNLPEG